MKNKLFLIFLNVVVLCIALVACGNRNNEIEMETPSSVQETTTEPTYFEEFDETEETIPDVENLTLWEYNKLTDEQQLEVMNTFETMDQFFEWYDEKVQDYQEYVEQQINPTEETTEPLAPSISVPSEDKMTYLEYYALSAEEQLAFINSFESVDEFFSWHTAAKKAYQDSMIEIDGTTPINLDDITVPTEG